MTKPARHTRESGTPCPRRDRSRRRAPSPHGRSWRLACVCLLLAGSLPAAEPESWSRYFPRQMATPADDAGWASLAEEFPNRVKPAADSLPPPAPAATRVEVKPGIEYVRVRQLANNLDTIAAALRTPRVILDLRYVHGELDPALQFGALLAREPLALDGGRTITPAESGRREEAQIALALVNRGTSGPLEAVLDALQHAGDILLVGTQTAGDTGIFAPVPDAPGWRVIARDLRREGGHTLVDVGVTPGLFVETTPDAEDTAYLAFDARQPVDELLNVPVEKPRYDEAQLQQRFNAAHRDNGRLLAREDGVAPEDEEEAPPAKEDEASAAPAGTDPAAPPPFDRSLQRAVATLVADTIFRDHVQVR